MKPELRKFIVFAVLWTLLFFGGFVTWFLRNPEHRNNWMLLAVTVFFFGEQLAINWLLGVNKVKSRKFFGLAHTSDFSHTLLDMMNKCWGFGYAIFWVASIAYALIFHPPKWGSYFGWVILTIPTIMFVNWLQNRHRIKGMKKEDLFK